MARFTESEVEDAALEWFGALGYQVLHGPEIAPGEPGAERRAYDSPLLPGRLEAALERLNPEGSSVAIEAALTRLATYRAGSLVAANRAFHTDIVDGIAIGGRDNHGRPRGETVRLIDFEDPDRNDWAVANQFTLIGQDKRRPDMVVFVNGLPLAVLELKNPADEHATIWSAFNQIATYKSRIPSLFHFNEACVISDGLEARIGSLSADRERFMPWRTIEGEELAPAGMPQLEVMIRGVFDRSRFLQFVRHFVAFEDDGSTIVKKIAGYHQFHAVNRALESTRSAVLGDDHRAGVVWHTQGSGKSLTMLFYAGRLALDPAFENPTLVVITDRNDLDDQLFTNFARCAHLLREVPVKVDSRAQLRTLLKRASGGVIFTTIQKFLPDERGDRHPLLTDRKNVIVIADEAHRSQYDFIDGFAAHMHDALPNASFIGFTGTPIELKDRNTPAVFGDYISIYDIQRAVEDKATVPIYYESRLAKLGLKEAEIASLDERFDEATEGEEVERRERLKTKWAALEAVIGADPRLDLIANDLVHHFELRQEALEGKAMVVCMSRRIAAELYNRIAALRPEWHATKDSEGAIKVVITGSASDPQLLQPHIRNKASREAMANRYKDPKAALKIVIVRDMWLTGFDVPSLHTMYVDKPMRGHGLMQAIARVNRVFRNKPGGLIVDYLGLADQLREAVATYTQSGGKGRAAIPEAEAILALSETYEVCSAFFHGYDWSPWRTGGPTDRIRLLASAQEHVLAQDRGKDRYSQAVTRLTQAYALAAASDEARRIRDDVAFFQAVRTALNKAGPDGPRDPELIEQAVRQLVSQAIASEEVVDIFATAGLKKPDISILSDGFLDEVRGMPHKNLAVELLRKLLREEIRVRSRKNVVESRSFAALLEQSILRYQNRAVETAQIIEELIDLAKNMRASDLRSKDLGLTEEEIAFYDALGTNDSAVQVLGDEVLKRIAVEIAQTIKKRVTLDWTIKETVRADLRSAVKRILRKYGYPPDMQARAVDTVIAQAEVIAADWSS